MADNLAAGNFDYSPRIKTKDEFKTLGDAFILAVQKLKEARRAEQEFGARMQKEVRNKTKDLEKKIKELELFNKISVDRELKMVELKKKIKELEKKLQEQ